MKEGWMYVGSGIFKDADGKQHEGCYVDYAKDGEGTIRMMFGPNMPLQIDTKEHRKDGRTVVTF